MTKKYLLTIVTCLIFVIQLRAHPSWSIVVDKYKNIYFADLAHNGNGTLWKLSKDGKLTALFKDFHCHKVVLDKDHNLLAEYVGKNDKEVFLIRIFPNGQTETLIQTENWDEFFVNCDVALSGNVYFNNKGYLWKRDVNGNVTKHSDHKLNQTQTLFVDELENVYAPDKGIDNGVIIKFDINGKAEIIASNLISELNRPKDPHNDVLLGITKGCDGHIYIAETAGQRIIKILDSIKSETFYKSDGDWFPTGIDFFAGDAYILEYKTNNGVEGPRITKIDEAGNKTELFNYDKYQKGNTPLINKNDNNGMWWIYLLSGTAILILIIGVRKVKNYRQQKLYDNAPSRSHYA